LLTGHGGTCLNPSYSEGGDRRIQSSRPAQAKPARFYLKNKIEKKGWESMAHGVDHFSNKHEDLGLISSTPPPKKTGFHLRVRYLKCVTMIMCITNK
jgi:hypothetical protein